MSKQKRKGTAYETAVVEYLREVTGDELIDRQPLHGSKDVGDVRGLYLRRMRVCAELKNRANLRIKEWFEELEREKGNADADIAMLICHRDGYGKKRIGQSYCVMTLEDALRLAMGVTDVY